MQGAEGDRSLRSFYDPIDKFKEDSDEAFYERVAKDRADVELVGGISLRGYGVIVAEAFHSGLLLPSAVYRQFDNEQLKGTIDDLHSHAQTVANKIADTAQGYSQNIPQAYMPVMGSRTFATIAHEGQWRRSKKPYISHPNGVASIILAAYGKRAEQDPHSLTLLTDLSTAYAHDAPEDTYTPDGSYLNKPIPTTPRVHQKVLMAYGFPNASRVARTNRKHAHVKGISEKIDYGLYIRDGASDPTVDFAVSKDADVLWNRFIEPNKYDGPDQAKIKKYADKDKQYDNGREIIIEEVRKRSGNGKSTSFELALIEAIRKVTEEDIERVQKLIPFLPEHVELAA